MSYTPNTWAKGDVVTSAKLNNIEQGIADGGIVTATATFDTETQTATLDKTWQEMYDANACYIKMGMEMPPDTYVAQWVFVDLVTYDSSSEHPYLVQGHLQSGDTQVYEADSADGYPVMSD